MANKILICTGIFPPDIGGPASYAVTLGNSIGKEVTVTVLTYSSKLRYKDDKNFPFKVVRVWRKWPKPIRYAFYFLRVLFMVSKSDVIFSLNTVSAGLPAILAAKMKKKRFFVKVVGDYAWEIAVQKNKSSFLVTDFQSSSKRGKIKTLARIQYWVCKKADGVIVPSKYLSNIVKGWGVTPERIHVIYNGVDFKKSELTKEEARKKIGIPGNIIITSGRLVPWKGFRMLIKIMPKILEINQFFRLIIIGDGPDKNILETIIKNMGLDRKVFLMGKKSKEDIATYMAASDMFVLNSGYEGFSHQILEAMAAGVPVIASAIGGNKELVQQGKNGFLVRYNDEFNLIEAIKGLWGAPEFRENFIEEGYETVKKFSVDKMIRETVEMLDGR